MQPNTIFFDFDGVLLDTIEAKGRAIAKAFERYGSDVYKKTYDFHLNHGGMNRRIKVKECYSLFLKQEITEELLENDLKIIAEEMKKELFKCQPVKGALDFMKQHSDNGGKSWIVSAAPEEEIKLLSEHFGYSKYVKAIYGFPHKKSDIITKIIQSNNFQLKECLMIGDAKEDFLAAEINQISFLLRKTTFSSFAVDYTGISIKDFTEANDAIQLL